MICKWTLATELGLWQTLGQIHIFLHFEGLGTLLVLPKWLLLGKGQIAVWTGLVDGNCRTLKNKKG